jgi:hypothetical protein
MLLGYSRSYDWIIATGALMKITGLQCVSLLLGAAALGMSMATVNTRSGAGRRARPGSGDWDVLIKALAG